VTKTGLKERNIFIGTNVKILFYQYRSRIFTPNYW